MVGVIHVEKHLRYDCFKEIHDSSKGGHFGYLNTLKEMKKRYYSEDMDIHILEWYNKCSVQKKENTKLKANMTPIIAHQHLGK